MTHFARAQNEIELEITNTAAVGWDSNNGPQNTIDGLLSTRWSASGSNAILTLDLGSVKSIGSISIAFYKGNERKTSFDLLLSSDGSVFQKYGPTLSSSGTTLNPERFALSGNARFIQIKGYGNSSAASAVWTSLTEVNVYAASAPIPPPTTAIASADILGQIQAETPFANQTGFTAQVMGKYPSINSIPEAGITGPQLSNGETLRLGKRTDPTDSLRKALSFQLGPNDPVTAGSHRCEFAGNRNIELKKIYWVAYKVFIPDWGNLPSGDQSLFGTQLHSGNDNLGLSPSFSFFTEDGGRNFYVATRYSTTAPSPSQSTTVRQNHSSHPIPFGRWVDFVIKFKQSINSSDNPFLQVWMDGTQILDYKGLLGYSTGSSDYMKFGFYSWTNVTSPRKILMRSPVVVQDPTGSKYQPADLRAYIQK